MLKFWNNDLKYVVESGEFKVFIGSSSKDTLEEKFEFIDWLLFSTSTPTKMLSSFLILLLLICKFVK